MGKMGELSTKPELNIKFSGHKKFLVHFEDWGVH
jgi:hypothetical protein